MKSSAFAPGHITCFFQVFEKGSRGLGITLEKGMRVTVTAAQETTYTINGIRRPFEAAEEVIRRYQAYLGEPLRVAIDFHPELPFGYGFGMSGAGALALSLALNDYFAVANRSFAVEVARDADIAAKTGLGDVIAENVGGVVLRKIPGDIDGIERIEYDGMVGVRLFGEIDTKGVIMNRTLHQRINTAGEISMKKVEKYFNNYSAHEDEFADEIVQISREFATQSGLAETFGVPMEKGYSMIMLGNALFSLTERGDQQIRVRNEGAEVY